MRPFEVINHTADIGIRAFGRSLKELYENAALGMVSLICDPERIEAKETRKIFLTERDLELLLASWLNELLYYFEVERLIFGEFNIIGINKNSLEAAVSGEKVSAEKHNLKTEIKAATYHQLKVEKKNEEWESQVIFDV